MEEINKITGRDYQLFNYYGAEDAESIIVAMGSVCEAIEETVDYLLEKGEKVGLLTVHLYRPFSIDHFFKYLPTTIKKVAVLDRTKEPGSLGEPLYLDVKAAFYNRDLHPIIVGGRYALGGKDVTPSHIVSIYENLKAEKPKDGFTVGIVDDVTFTSLPTPKDDIDTTAEGTTACKFWGMGSDGTVGANKSAIKIIGDNTEMYAQAYFAYDSKKSGGITMSHLRFGKLPIKSPYLIHRADFISCSQQAYVDKYNLLAGLKENGTFLLNSNWSHEEIEQNLPLEMKRYLATYKINFYVVNAVGIAQELGLGGRFNMIMQSAFFKLANIIPIDLAVKYLKDAVITSYGNKGEKVVNMNCSAIDRGIDGLVKIDVPESWADLAEAGEAKKDVPYFIKTILEPMNRQEGDRLPVSAFEGMEDGTFPLGTAAYEKRGTAIKVPEWIVENCIQCNQCSYVCPHATIRPALLDEAEAADAPAEMKLKDAIGAKGLKYTMAISPLDCTGCGNCAQVCPAKEKALVMKPLATQLEKSHRNWEYATNVSPKQNPMNKLTVKGSQFEKPLLEFSGACAGCGETPYAKLVTQLFGDRMMVANATGCSSIWGGSAPSIPYTINHQGQGPAWANSLFEDNAEFGLGMLLGVKAIRAGIANAVEEVLRSDVNEKVQTVLREWLDKMEEGAGTRDRADAVIQVLATEKGDHALLNKIYDQRDFLVKQSQWIFGGDGWAYDIGFGGLDHVLASGEDVNVLVFDTEVYSNTGGQSSKATPAAAMAQFAATGKKTKKKDLGMMAMSYGYVYVAQIAMGADKNQTLKAIAEAEAYPGPSLIIAYAPCINHGIKIGMGASHLETKRAVESGYWEMYRYNPSLKEAGKNPFSLDSKAPTMSFKEFLEGEVRYNSLQRQYPDIAEELFEKTEQDAKVRRAIYEKMANREQ